ncbi:MAG: LptE family protein [Ignavibacteriales bacterium]|nr:LptE family protein [Ignavibacteriales bacterium]
MYSFTGSSVPSHLKTIAIPLFDDQSGAGEPGLREKLTNKLIDHFRQDNNLEIADKTHADSILEGIITSIPDQPQVVEKGETVTKRRVTVSVKVTYQDMKLKKKIYDKEYSAWGDYLIGGGPAQRQTGIDAAIEKLTEDILIDTVSGW